MAAEGEFSSGWKVMVVLAVVVGLLAIAVSTVGSREDPRVTDLQERIRELERKQHQQIIAPGSKGGKAVVDREYGE